MTYKPNRMETRIGACLLINSSMLRHAQRRYAMSTTGRMKHLMIATGLTASLFFGAAARAGAVSFGTNGGSYSFTFEENGDARTGYPPSINNPAAAYARAP